MNLRVSPEALNDLKEIQKYISVNLNNPAAASRIIKNIVQSYLKLPDSPLIGSPLNAKINLDTPYRYLVCGNYLVFYKCTDEYIEIIRIIYGRRDYIKILFQDEYKNMNDISDDIT